jgi:hypothetical protein
MASSPAGEDAIGHGRRAQAAEGCTLDRVILRDGTSAGSLKFAEALIDEVTEWEQ